MQTFEVIGRLLRHNGKQLKVGDKVRMSAADGAALASRGRVKAATGAQMPPSKAAAKAPAPE